MFSLDDLDQPKACERPHEFEVKDDLDKPTGFFLSVIGGQALVITQLVEERAQKQRVDEALAKKADPRGKRVHVTDVKEDVEFNDEIIAIRIVGWRGAIKEEFSPANAMRLVKNNPWSIREQIIAKTEDMKNFPMVVATN